MGLSITISQDAQGHNLVLQDQVLLKLQLPEVSGTSHCQKMGYWVRWTNGLTHYGCSYVKWLSGDTLVWTE